MWGLWPPKQGVGAGGGAEALTGLDGLRGGAALQAGQGGIWLGLRARRLQAGSLLWS
jgi:hypothetical protein